MSKIIILIMLLIAPSISYASDSTVGRLYQERCMMCHGVYGNGKGVLSEFLTPKPRDFTSYDEMRPLSGDNDAIEKIIKQGKPGTAMPAFGSHHLDGDPLTDSQVKSLAKYVQSFLAQEQFMLQTCVFSKYEFDTMVDGDYKIEVSNNELSVTTKKSIINITAKNPKKLVFKMLNNKKRATRTYFKVVQNNEVLLLMTVRFNSPCPEYLKKSKGHRLTKVF